MVKMKGTRGDEIKKLIGKLLDTEFACCITLLP